VSDAWVQEEVDAAGPCPACGAADPRPIVYGMPDPSARPARGPRGLLRVLPSGGPPPLVVRELRDRLGRADLGGRVGGRGAELADVSRIAVRVHGCFWHGCPEHFHAPNADAEWWRLKLASVVARDADTERALIGAGCLPLVVWEHEDMTLAADRILRLDRSRRQSQPEAFTTR
jgi:DNA mismatch endonuclease Vsr